MAQYMYEKWLSEYRGKDPEIPKQIQKRLHEIHIGWASVHLLDGHTQASLQSLSLALRYAFSKKAAVKWVSTRVAPALTKRILVKRREKEPPPLL
jgi:hypothetical protein